MEEKKPARAKRQTAAAEPEETAPAAKKTTVKKNAAKKADPLGETPATRKPRVIKKTANAETLKADEAASIAAPAEPTETVAGTVETATPKKTTAAKAPKSAAEKTTVKKSAAKTKKAAIEEDETVKPKRKAAVKKTKAASVEAAALDVSDETRITALKTESETTAPAPPIKTESAPEIEAKSAGEIEPADAPQDETAAEPEAGQADIFKKLSEPILPALAPENRARLQIQSPTRIFLYWSVKNNPYETLHRAFGNRADGYRLVVKLKNLSASDEKLLPIDSEGSWWFDAESNSAYQAEIGFYNESSPFIRLMFSNTARTPRSAPSPNTDWSMDFIVTADQFAEVLDAAGYAQDAFDVAIAGDDQTASDEATRKTFAQVTGNRAERTEPSELRYALFTLASGESLESSRGRISESLYRMLENALRKNAEKLSAENIHLALKENFVFEGEGDEFVAPVFGASSINFPKKSKRPKFPGSSQIVDRVD